MCAKHLRLIHICKMTIIICLVSFAWGCFYIIYTSSYIRIGSGGPADCGVYVMYCAFTIMDSLCLEFDPNNHR